MIFQFILMPVQLLDFQYSTQLVYAVDYCTDKNDNTYKHICPGLISDDGQSFSFT
jgi:hypothetical protein